jgi:integrase
MLANILGTLSSMLNRAKDWGYICEGVQKRKLVLPDRGIKKSVRFFTADECRRIIAAAVNPYRSMYALAVMTGLRVGEVLGLRWEDIDFEQGTVRICQTVWRGEIQSPKTIGSEDVLPMPGPLSVILRQHLKSWKPNPHGLIFVNSRSNPWIAENVVRDHLGPLLEALKIPHGGFHAFRHAHSTLLIHGGASVKVAQEQLRHADPRITIARYSHVIGDARREAVERLASEISDSNGLQQSGNEETIQ